MLGFCTIYRPCGAPFFARFLQESAGGHDGAMPMAAKASTARIGTTMGASSEDTYILLKEHVQYPKFWLINSITGPYWKDDIKIDALCLFS